MGSPGQLDSVLTRRGAARLRNLRKLHLGSHSGNDATCDFFLNGEDIFKRSIIALCPQMIAGRSFEARLVTVKVCGDKLLSERRQNDDRTIGALWCLSIKLNELIYLCANHNLSV